MLYFRNPVTEHFQETLYMNKRGTFERVDREIFLFSLEEWLYKEADFDILTF